MALVALSAVGCDQIEPQLPSYQKGYQPTQPIKYSHKLHAGDLGIDCKYCHFGAENSKHAGIPPVNVCLNCHKVVKANSPEVKKIQEAYDSGKSIEWIRIHKLPDFVSFDHSRHVNRGVACQTCHGPVQTMDVLTRRMSMRMSNCLACHRAPQEALPAGSPIKRGPEECSACHR